MREIEVVMERLASDPSFRAQFAADSDTALSEYHLTESEHRLLARCRPLLALTPQVLHTRWMPDIGPNRPIWWDEMRAHPSYGA